jgi:prevent-host-death family protein
MMIKRYSIAEARNRFTSLVRDVETAPGVEITRHGEPVAVLLSYRQYQHLSNRQDFWDSYESFCKVFDLSTLKIETEIFEDVRDTSPGREVNA